jgi:hypothetical protein
MVNPSLTKPKQHVIKNCSYNLIDILFQMFWRINLKPFFVSNPISFSFFFYFEWSKNLWGVLIRYIQDLFQVQMQQNNDKRT